MDCIHLKPPPLTTLNMKCGKTEELKYKKAIAAIAIASCFMDANHRSLLQTTGKPPAGAVEMKSLKTVKACTSEE